MSLVFKSETTVEFDSEEDLMVFLRQMPWPEGTAEAMLKGKVFHDSEDQANITGAGQTIHKFSVTGKE